MGTSFHRGLMSPVGSAVFRHGAMGTGGHRVF